MAKRTKKPKIDKTLRGRLPSGCIFIGDPSYFGGDMNLPGAEQDAEQDGTNPFKNWGNFTVLDQVQELNLPLPFSSIEGTVGRGCVIQTPYVEGKFTLKKKICKETGKVLEIRIIFKD